MYIIILVAGRDQALGTRQTTTNMTATVQWGREGHQGPGLAEVAWKWRAHTHTEPSPNKVCLPIMLMDITHFD